MLMKDGASVKWADENDEEGDMVGDVASHNNK
jgi:hypothetical protein